MTEHDDGAGRLDGAVPRVGSGEGNQRKERAMLGFLFALIVWAIIGTIRENRAINRGEIPCKECFACTRYWMFEDSKKKLNEVGLRRYIEMNEIEICEYRRRELYGEDEGQS